MAECDVDDILCQSMALAHLKGLKNVLGNERYKTEFPELQALDEKITSREESLRTTLAACVDKPVEPVSEEAEPIKVKVNAVREVDEQ